MIISPPFLPQIQVPANSTAEDPLMDEIDKWIDIGGRYPIAFDRRWHTGLHLRPKDQSMPVRAIADGEVVAYRVCGNPLPDGFDDKNTNGGFVLLKHTTETGEGRTLTFYSLYMHLLDLNSMTSSGIVPPPVGQPNTMPQWLRVATGAAVQGNGKTVRRKDILGYVGQVQGGTLHLHFEIFATADGFKYFNATQLGHQDVATAQGRDCWGHTYYVIPKGQNFLAQPPGVDSHNKLHGIKFEPKDAGLNPAQLYVEVYFHKGNKFTNVWSVADDGSRTVLARDQADPAGTFEYEMYSRAKALYPACPSDGYDLLRFGRILTEHPTLVYTQAQTPPPVASVLPGNPHPAAVANPCATWLCFPFDNGKSGYIDISTPAIKKLSDADFPFFMGWQKIQAASGPFDQGGLWDLEKLKALVRASIGATEGAAAPSSSTTQQTSQQINAAMEQYLNLADDKVKALLRGFICEAPSEWDKSNTDIRFRNLLDAGEHFEGNPTAYDQFKTFVESLQFWDKTGLHPGEKLWFLHPLAFIRHFRRCGWLSADELAKTMPKYPFYGQHGNTYVAQKSNSIYIMEAAEVKTAQKPYVAHLSRAINKFGLNLAHRRALFLAQTHWETAQWRNLVLQNHPIMHEWGFGAYSGGSSATQYYAAFYGRGAMQLTWAANYRDYGNFCGQSVLPDHVGPYSDHLHSNAPRITATSTHWTVHPNDHGTQIRWAPRFDPNIVADDPFHACNSAGFYWVSKPFQAGVNIGRKADAPWSFGTVQNVSRGVNGGENGKIERQAYSLFAAYILLDSTFDTYEPVINTPVGTIKVDLTRIM